MLSKVDARINGEKKWRKEFRKLQAIALGCKLAEDLKWGQPCYTLGDRNIVILQSFKDYCALGFFKGALLRDVKHLLKTPGAHQSFRQLRFSSVPEISKASATVRSYIREAIAAEKSGLKVKLKKTSDYKIPEELQAKLKQLPAFKAAFDALTPGRQRGYLFFFSQPKQSKTRAARVEKCLPQILKGKGLQD